MLNLKIRKKRVSNKMQWTMKNEQITHMTKSNAEKCDENLKTIIDK
jgi:hypothetical protein